MCYAHWQFKLEQVRSDMGFALRSHVLSLSRPPPFSLLLARFLSLSLSSHVIQELLLRFCLLRLNDMHVG